MLSAGQTIAHFEVIEELGAGGMGVVFKARDTRLGRLVALKVLPAARGDDQELRARLLKEARAASSLNHPNIITVYEAGSAGEVDFIAMEYIEGALLSQRIPPGGMELPEALAVARAVASALASAHAAGVVHRDLKPANVMLRADAVVKVLDFGLAKAVAIEEQPEDITRTAGETIAGTVLGTGPYMSPEQAEGKPVDARSDIFSFGAMLYEMLTGRRAFQGSTLISTLSAVLKDTPPPVRTLRAQIPPGLEHIVERCLKKGPEERYASGGELTAAFGELGAERGRSGGRGRRIAAGVAAAALLTAGSWLGVRQWRARWVYHQAIPQILRLSADHNYTEAYTLIRRAEAIVPGDAVLERALDESGCCLEGNILSDPPGALVYLRPYAEIGAGEELAGKTPLKTRLPKITLHVRLTKDGFEDTEGSWPAGIGLSSGGLTASFHMDGKGRRPAGMVSVAPESILVNGSRLSLPAFWLDKYEVSNRQFKQFVDAGGYRNRSYWKAPIERDGREVSWDEALKLFVDTTGKAGPANWELGSYPEGQADYPVSGVSWYEAAAFAEYAGKSLPTVAHWRRAADYSYFSDVIQFSNFSGQGVAPVGKFRGLGPSGTYDMAGNVREWCFNAVGNSRALLGGGWNDASYKYADMNAADPMERSPENGFRCAKYGEAPPSEAFVPIRQSTRDPGKETPASDQTFRAYRNAFAYDRTPLDAKVEAVDDSAEYYRRQKISYAAAYGGERILAWLFLPKNAAPPYQTVVYYPSSEATLQSSSTALGQQRYLLFLMRSGRALIHPIYKGTYERIGEPVSGPNAARERVIARGKDLGRSIDYLETRPEIDRGKLAYYGTSMGAREGVVMTAIEPRFRAAILAWGGIPATRLPDGIDTLDFAPRVKIPVLMLNGRNDFYFPYTTSALPLFRLLGTPEKDKKMFLSDVGHVAVFSPEMVKETLDWLDRYLGPAK